MKSSSTFFESCSVEIGKYESSLEIASIFSILGHYISLQQAKTRNKKEKSKLKRKTF
jgi:hypothetical protein